MSLYLPDLNAVFVHVPKCGGTWVKAVLEKSGIRCEAARGVGTHNLPSAYADRGRRFMFVREPLRWYESAWKGLHSGWPLRSAVAPLHKERSWSPIRLLTYLVGAREFHEFAATLVTDQPGFCSRMFEWYAGPPGAPQVDFVGRMEFVREDLTTILRWLGFDGELADLSPENVGEAASPVWDESLRNKVRSMEFGYERWYTTPGPMRVE